jgi:hypothetical protein
VRADVPILHRLVVAWSAANAVADDVFRRDRSYANTELDIPCSSWEEFRGGNDEAEGKRKMGGKAEDDKSDEAHFQAAGTHATARDTDETWVAEVQASLHYRHNRFQS